MFKVYKNLIDSSLIDKILAAHESVKNNWFSFFRAQGTTRFERPILNRFNNQINSIHNPHLLGFNSTFSSLIEKAIISENISKCLSDFSGADKHTWYQSMFFDNSTGTRLHQDTWYLDTIPNGKLCGVWIALEDIGPSAGPFCIYTNTDKFKLQPTDFDFDDLERDLKFKEKFPDAVRYDFYAEKGDVLIWDSFSIHGALLPTGEANTRKSITAYFYPAGIQIQNPPIKRFFSIYDHLNPTTTTNNNIFKATTINPRLFQAICGILFFLEKFKPLKNLLMREGSNKRISEIRRL